MESSPGHPPFMTGLLAARKLLVELKQKKISQLEKEEVQLQPIHPPLQVVQVVSQSQPIPEQVPEKEREEQPQSKRSILGQRINNIGRQLHECYGDTVAYELIFARLASYYGSQIGIVDRNEHLKREGFHLEEQIHQYQHKIRYNYQAIQQNQQNIAEMHKVTQEALRTHLIEEKEKAEIEPHISLTAVNSANIKFHKQAIVEFDSSSSISLNWRSLSQKTAKKAIARKQRVDDQMAGSMFHSQMYNI